MKHLLSLFIFCFLVHISSAQEVRCDIIPTYKKSIKKEVLNTAKSILDINPEFPASWVEVYHQIDLKITQAGVSEIVTTVGDNLMAPQIEMLAHADIASEVELNIKYTPKNSDEIRNIKFAYTVVPDTEAKYPEGQDMDSYLRSAIVDKLSLEVVNKIEMVKVRFTVDKDGQLINPVLDQSTKNREADSVLIDAIKNMPQWSPARKTDGSFVTQDFELVFGMLAGC